MGQNLQQILSENVLCKVLTDNNLFSQDISEIPDLTNSVKPDCLYCYTGQRSELIGTSGDKEVNRRSSSW